MIYYILSFFVVILFFQNVIAESCNIKGNISYTTGEKIYHVPGCEYYDATTINTRYGERRFCSEDEARSAGWRKAMNCPISIHNNSLESIDIREYYEEKVQESFQSMWYERDAMKLAGNGIINKQYDPDLYKVDSSITRRELLKIVINFSKKPLSSQCRGKFVDIPKTDWGCVYAETALSNGYVSANSRFRPNDEVTNIEALKIMFKVKGITPDYSLDWKQGYISKGEELGLFNSMDYPNAKASRGFIFHLAVSLFY